MTSLVRLAEFLAATAAIVLAWQAYVVVFDVPAFMLPAPAAVGDAMLALAASGQLWRSLAFTLGNVVTGFLLGAAAGIAVGVFLANAPRVEAALSGPILFLQTAPKIALAPLFVIWFGLGVASKILLVVSLVFFPAMIGMLTGLRGVDRRLLDLARLLDLSPFQRFRRIELPASLPELFVGLRVGAVQAVVGAILGEWMSGRQGLGHLMTYASATYRTPMLFAAVILTVLLGILVYAAIDGAERRLLAWRDDA
jgi:NitT/TauT family transport system permease protein